MIIDNPTLDQIRSMTSTLRLYASGREIRGIISESEALALIDALHRIDDITTKERPVTRPVAA